MFYNFLLLFELFGCELITQIRISSLKLNFSSSDTVACLSTYTAWQSGDDQNDSVVHHNACLSLTQGRKRLNGIYFLSILSLATKSVRLSTSTCILSGISRSDGSYVSVRSHSDISSNIQKKSVSHSDGLQLCQSITHILNMTS